MVLRKLFIAIACLLVFTSGQAYLSAAGLSGKESKKVLKLLSKEFDVDRSDLELTPVTNPGLKSDYIEGVSRLAKKGEPLGYVVSAVGMGRYDHFYYLVYYNEEREVEFVRVMKYYSDHGGEIQSKRWLNQFAGYDGGDLDYGDEVQAISGATLSAGSITKGIREITIRLQNSNL
jgi:hypothetical protein